MSRPIIIRWIICKLILNISDRVQNTFKNDRLVFKFGFNNMGKPSIK